MQWSRFEMDKQREIDESWKAKEREALLARKEKLQKRIEEKNRVREETKKRFLDNSQIEKVPLYKRYEQDF